MVRKGSYCTSLHSWIQIHPLRGIPEVQAFPGIQGRLDIQDLEVQ